NITYIGNGAFGYCTGLTNLTIPAGVTNIGSSAFYSCTNLPSVVIPNHVSTIGDTAFYFCSNVTSLTISTNLTTITNWVFTYLNLTNAIIPASVTNIGDYALGGWYHAKAIYFLGNAPSQGAGVCQGDPATVYYLPGTTNWGPFFGECPTMEWNPQVQTHDRNFGVRTNRFGFNITGNNNLVVKVEACTNLSNPTWVPLGTNTLNGGSSYFSDPAWAGFPRRFYRLDLP